MRQKLPWMALCAGIVYTLFLQFYVPRDVEVFYNGDGGIKMLLVKQYATGGWGTDLRLAAPPWVQKVWREGYYPFANPFVYDMDGKFVQCFPVWFPALSTPFYAMLGRRGVYLLPLLATWMLWLCFLQVCRRLDLPAAATAWGLVLLIFAAPVTLYSAIFWEHTLAVALAFFGLCQAPWFQPDTPAALWRRRLAFAILGGVALGFSGWLRPENLCFAAAVLTTSLIASRQKECLVYTAATCLTVGLYLALNYAWYGQPLGAHSFDVVQRDNLLQHRMSDSPQLLRTLLSQTFLYFPAICMAAFRPGVERKRLVALLLTTVALQMLFVCCIIPHSGGKQWGPRYVMAVVPLVCLSISCILASRPRLAWLLLPLVAWGCWRNTVVGTGDLVADYGGRILPALRYVQASPYQCVVTLDQYAPQELEAAMTHKYFFRINRFRDVTLLARPFEEHGQNVFLYIVTLFDQSLQLPPTVFVKGDTYDVRCNLVGKFGYYLWIMRCDILPKR